MATGETLLKLSDFPFAYSLSLIVGRMIGLDFQDDGLIVLLGSAGALGTFLTIVDPFGRLVRAILKRGLRKKTDTQTPYMIRSLETRAISVEVDKIVSTCYFMSILLLFAIVVLEVDTFSEKMWLTKLDGQIICNQECARIIGYATSLGALGVIIIVINKNWTNLKKYIEIAGTYQFGIGSEYVTRETIDRMSRPIEQNDWPTAKEWEDIVKKEIATKKGKKESILREINEVYHPLYLENLSIISNCKNIIVSGTYGGFSTTEWDKISSKPSFPLIEDKEFIKEIGELYDIIKKYNPIQANLNHITEDIIKKAATKFYDRQIDTVSYWIRSSQGNSAPGLSYLLLSGKHPSKFYPEETNPTPTHIELYKNGESKITRLESVKDFEDFDKFWEMAVNEANKNPDLLSVKVLFDKILPKAEKLNEKLVEKIGMQVNF